MKVNNNIIAHRGMFNNIDIPENSLSAFKNALKKDIAIELDVQLTKDDVLVVFHDENIKRMTGINKELKDINYDELKTYHLLNTKETIPTFKEVINLINSKVMLDIEVKTTKHVEKISNILLKQLANYNNFVIKSFNPKIVRYIKKTNPNIEVGYLMTDDYNNRLYNLLLPSKLMIKYSKANFLALDKKLLKKKKYLKTSHKYPTLIWTIKAHNEMKDNNYIYICNNLLDTKKEII